ncbi:hypothetical protein [Duganella sp. Root1480D1]|uniref:hypothetical protein n=1 Tax=Duganella sp. Root1480D1 TaxID=1736471 RepID=UPI0007093740|nr:hypothetical protein [Duganella sp. Root1480D1]KQZ34143.1 hypothetical protein ASD58_29085 [Duganella sp. Root1480D1]
MQTSLFYIFSPTEALLSVAREFIPEDDQLLKAEVWSVICHDRIGCELQRDNVEAAYWTNFAARLLYEAPEPAQRLEFRTRCLSLGMHGCWTVAVTGRGGPATELVDDAREAAAFLADNGIRLSVGL